MESKKDIKKITANMHLDYLNNHYPEIANYLQLKYGLHCINCFLAGDENLEQGAAVHGIVGKDFEELLKDVNRLVNSKF